MITLATSITDGAKIKVIGVGGGGGNAVNNMIDRGIKNVDFIVTNTDRQALDSNKAQIKIQAGAESTRGLGAGANPNVGQRAVEESIDKIRESLAGSDMVFITAGMGGGTGTGGSPAVAQVGKELGALVVGIVTTPFQWEGKTRRRIAQAGIDELRKYVDALIVIPNQKLLEIVDKNTSFADAFKIADEVLLNATRGIADIIDCHGYVNVDFADVRTIMSDRGDALMGIGTASGENRALEATEKALNSPLLDGISIEGAQGVLVNISGGSNIGMLEVSAILEAIGKAAGEEANIIHGVVMSNEPSDDINVTVVATGFNKNVVKPTLPIEREERQSLPFYGGGNNSYNKKPVVTFGEKEKTDSKKESIPVTPSFTQSPKGLNQLKKYAEPAYMRNNEKKSVPKPNLGEFGNKRVSDLRADDDKPYKAEPVARDKMEKPAFLRRMLD